MVNSRVAHNRLHDRGGGTHEPVSRKHRDEGRTVVTHTSRPGDVVRENWSGVPGMIVAIDGDEAIVRYPSGRQLRSRLEWLVPAESRTAQ